MYGLIFAITGIGLFADNPKAFTEKIGSEHFFIAQSFYEALESNSKTRGQLGKLGLKYIVILPDKVATYKNLKDNSIIDLLQKKVKLYKNIEYIDVTDFMRNGEKTKRDLIINTDGGQTDFVYLFSNENTGKAKTLRMPNTAFNNMSKKIGAHGYKFNPEKDKYFAILPCNYVTSLETLNFFLQLGVCCYIDPLKDFSKVAEYYYRSGATIIMCPPDLLEPLYMVITPDVLKQLNFIIETIKNSSNSTILTEEGIKEKLKLFKEMILKNILMFTMYYPPENHLLNI